MPVSFDKNTTVVAEGNVPAIIFSHPHPMGGMNHVAVTLLIESIVNQTSGTPKLTVQAQGSNDGIEYTDVSTVVVSIASSADLHSDDGSFTYAFLRFKYTLDPDGSGTELAFMTFDVDANLTHS